MTVRVAIKVTIPNLAINDRAVRSAIEKAMRQTTGPQMRKLFEQTVEGWEERPRFSTDIHNWVQEVGVKVSTTSDIYAYVNNGTPAHTIKPTRTPFLRFQPGYIAATRPRMLSSGKPRRFGTAISTMMVRHPGIQAREFDREVADRIELDFAADMQLAIARTVNTATK